MSGPLRSILPIAAGLIVIVVAAVAVALLAAPDEAVEFPQDSPEGTVQRFLRAIQDRNIEDAYEMLSSSVREDVSRDEFRRFAGFGRDDELGRIRVDDVDVRDDRATVELTIERVRGEGIELDRVSFQRSVPLVREEDAWRIDDAYSAVISTRRPPMTG